VSPGISSCYCLLVSLALATSDVVGEYKTLQKSQPAKPSSLINFLLAVRAEAAEAASPIWQIEAQIEALHLTPCCCTWSLLTFGLQVSEGSVVTLGREVV
jgi:hypothetical protein